MRNRDRYGKGKSWDVRIHEDGIYCVAIQIDAPAHKEEHSVTVTEFQEIDRGEVGKFLVELGESIQRLASGAIKPSWVVEDGVVKELGDEDFPF